MTRTRAYFWCLIILIVWITGCGSRGDGRLAVSGIVRLDGKPATGGRILFTPQKGNSGPGAGGTIDANGQFSISAAEGPAGGPYFAKIILNPVSASEKFKRRTDQDNKSFEQAVTLTEEDATGLEFELTTPEAPAVRGR